MVFSWIYGEKPVATPLIDSFPYHTVNVQDSYSAAGGFDPDITLKIWQDENIINRDLSPHYAFKSLCVYDRKK